MADVLDLRMLVPSNKYKSVMDHKQIILSSLPIPSLLLAMATRERFLSRFQEVLPGCIILVAHGPRRPQRSS